MIPILFELEFTVRKPLLGYELIISVSPCTLTKRVSSGLLLIGPLRLTTPGWGYTKILLLKLMEILKKNLFPTHLIEGVVNHYITGTLSNHCRQGFLPTSPIFCFKLPYIGHFSVVTQKKIHHFIKCYCNDLDIKLIFSSFKDRQHV